MTQHKFLVTIVLSLVSFLFFHSIQTLAQAPAPGPTTKHGPTNVVKILKKAGEFKTFIRLLKSTQLDSNLNSQLGDTNNGLTIFAPSDSAFSALKSGTISSLTHQEKIELVQFHIIPFFVPKFDGNTSIPLKTHAGSGGRFLFNVTSHGGTISVTTGLTNTTISGTVYVDKNLAIYQIDKVLLPLDIFTPLPPAPAPAPAKSKVKTADDASAAKDVLSATTLFTYHNFGMVVMFFYLLHVEILLN